MARPVDRLFYAAMILVVVLILSIGDAMATEKAVEVEILRAVYYIRVDRVCWLVTVEFGHPKQFTEVTCPVSL